MKHICYWSFWFNQFSFVSCFVIIIGYTYISVLNVYNVTTFTFILILIFFLYFNMLYGFLLILAGMCVCITCFIPVWICIDVPLCQYANDKLNVPKYFSIFYYALFPHSICINTKLIAFIFFPQHSLFFVNFLWLRHAFKMFVHVV